MSDLISRQSAINALYHHFPHMTREECAAILHEVGSDREEQTRGKWMLYQKGSLATNVLNVGESSIMIRVMT